MTAADLPLSHSGALARPRAIDTTGGRRSSSRLGSVDVLRGLVMVLMALDHVRYYFTNVPYDPLDLSQTTAPLFLTRWITHFCAPVFIVLAGMSAYMAGRRRSKPELSRFLLSRGLWLVLLEFTVVGFGWYMNTGLALGYIAQVIWAIGVSMIVLAGVIWLPRMLVAAGSLALILGHNLFDGLQFDGVLGNLWTVLHVQGSVESLNLMIMYPLVPWVAVMALGYSVGPWLVAERSVRTRNFLVAGVVSLSLFVLIRAAGFYGDSSPWQPTGDLVTSALSFINVTKYPPSLMYLLLTLGAAALALVALERLEGPVARGLRTFGQVALFYYVAHLYVIHALAILVGQSLGYSADQMARLFLYYPESWGFGLPVVYLVWLAVVAGLYPVCRWYARQKRIRSGWWWSYV